MIDTNYEDMKKLVRDNVCAQCGGELTIRANPEKGGELEIWCPHHPDHRGYVERETWTQEFRRGKGAPLVIKDKIEKKMLPGGYPLSTALALIKTRFPRADLDDPSAALFVMDCIRLDLDPLLGEIVPVTFKVTDKETKEVRRIVQPVLTEDGWLSLCARACPERWIGSPKTYPLEDYLRTLSENKGKSGEEIDKQVREFKENTVSDSEAYFWVAWGKVKVDDQIIETAPSYGWLKKKDWEKAQKAEIPAGELPGNQARIRAIKRWARENFPEAKAKMKELTSEWLARGKDIEGVQEIIAAEYHIVTETPPSKPGASAAELVAEEQEGFSINLEWLGESLKEIKWDGDTAKTWLVHKYKVSPTGTLEDVIRRLTREQAEEFVKEIQERTAKKQMELF